MLQRGLTGPLPRGPAGAGAGFWDSDDLDACPKLRNRPQGRLSALCVPVSIMGRTVGVIHATGKPEARWRTPRSTT